MKKEKWLYTFTISMIILLAITGCYSSQTDSSQNEIKQAENNSHIATLAQDSVILPDELTDRFDRSYWLETDITTTNIDALLVSSQVLLTAQQEALFRDQLLHLVDEGVIILVYDSTPQDLRSYLDIDIPTSSTATNRYAVASLAKTRKGGYITGGILVGRHVSLEDESDPIDIPQDVKEHVDQILDVAERW